MPDSACVGLAVQGLQQLPEDRNSAIIKEAFVVWRRRFRHRNGPGRTRGQERKGENAYMGLATGKS
eukprot:6179709-Pleurochrysis_carterae.AAC.1